MKTFVKNGSSLSIPDCVPLMELTLWDDYTYEHVLFLIQNGANVTELNFHNYSPLFNVVWDGKIKIAQLLFSNGANIKQVNSMGTNLANNLVVSPNFNAVFLAWLFRVGVDPLNKDKDGENISFQSKKNIAASSISKLLDSFFKKEISLEQLIDNLEETQGKLVSPKEKISHLYYSINHTWKHFFLEGMIITIGIERLSDFSNSINRIIYEKALDDYCKGNYITAFQSMIYFPNTDPTYLRLELIAKILVKFSLYEEAKEISGFL